MKNNFPEELVVPFTAPLNKLDTPTQTYGCRHSNPDICGSCYLEKVCAFVRKDNMCLKPSKKWCKQYEILKEQKNENI